MKRHSEQGMALVITLMMLAITTFTAVVFLSLSRRERSNVKTVEEQLNSRMMADNALARAQADIVSRMQNEAEKYLSSAVPLFGPTNAQRHIAIANRAVQRAVFQYDLQTSRNFFNPNGFNRADRSSPWNVGEYDEFGNVYDSADRRLGTSSDDYYQHIANLQYDPRPPVIVNDNGTNDYRFFIDLNRNGRFDPNVVTDVTGVRNERYSASNRREATSGPFLAEKFVGDPEWIGVLERPDLPHSETNRFIGRYAYIALPTGKSLDVNFIHNLARFSGSGTTLRATDSKFTRNQGVGSWELNLAGFLVDLHTNVWKPGGYVMTGTNQATGYVFEDAVGIVQYRLNRSRANLLTPQDVFGGVQLNRWPNDLVDMAGDGPIIPYNAWYSSRPVAQFGLASLDNDDQTRFWHGAERMERTGEFPDVQRYFRLKTPSSTSEMLGFYNRFTNAISSSRTNTYDRYAYYRMLAQMGADSRPAIDGKIHLNFANEPGRISTNLALSWISTNGLGTPLMFARSNAAVLVRRNDGGQEYQVRPNNLTNFFLIAAEAMLKASLVTNVYLDNFGALRTNYTIGSSFFDKPEWNAITNDPVRVRRIVATPVRPDISITNIQIFHRTNAVNTWRPNDLTFTNNEYSAALHRILQLAANIYDNMTNNAGSRSTHGANDPFFPTVFRPIYNLTATNITIVGWQPEDNAAFARRHAATTPGSTNFFVSPRDYFYNPGRPSITNVSFFGQPWVIGVKKGWPTFNEFSIETYAQVTRKLEVLKDPATERGKKIFDTNSAAGLADLARRTRQIFMVGFSNSFGVEAWNSYAQTLKRDIRIEAEVQCDFGVERVLRRDSNNVVLLSVPITVPTNRAVFTAGITVQKDPGWPARPVPHADRPLAEARPTVAAPGIANGSSDYRVPIYGFVQPLGDSEFVDLPPPYGGFIRNPNPVVWQSLTNTPDLRLNITNRLRYVAIDGEENRVIDYVTLDNLVTAVDLDQALRGQQNASTALVGGEGRSPVKGEYWDSALVLPNDPAAAGLTKGILRQIEVSMGIPPISDADWKSYAPFANKTDEIVVFRDYMNGSTNETIQTNVFRQVPYSPTRQLYIQALYQANDPLVHYTIADLKNPLAPTRPDSGFPTTENKELGKRNFRKQSIRHDGLHGPDFQDPGVRESDDWQFPIAKFDDPNTPGGYGIRNFHYRYPNIGALGQIHRGTPWQTVYLKALAAPNIDPTTSADTRPPWILWGGSYGTHPTNDWKLVGLFTTAITENAARGLLSVNQSEVAAWSAVLSGIPAITNSWKDSESKFNAPRFGVPPTLEDPLIQPGSRQMNSIVRSINLYRDTRPMKVFSYLGEVLGSSMLSVGNRYELYPNRQSTNLIASPFLNISNGQIKVDNDKVDWHAFTDDALEAIPQRILSLLKEDEPRMTIYCFGQTLKPAPRSYVTSSDFYNLCINYQVTGEYVTKAIVRVEGEIAPPDPLIDNDSSIPAERKRDWKLQRQPFKTVVESFEALAPFE